MLHLISLLKECKFCNRLKKIDRARLLVIRNEQRDCLLEKFFLTVTLFAMNSK